MLAGYVVTPLVYREQVINARRMPERLRPLRTRPYRYRHVMAEKVPRHRGEIGRRRMILHFTQTIFNMPLIESDAPMAEASSNDLPDRLPFPPTTYSHILHCSYHDWHPR